MANGIVVDHKKSGVRYAISEKNFNPKVHKKVRELEPGETVHGFQPMNKRSLSAIVTETVTPTKSEESALVDTEDAK